MATEDPRATAVSLLLSMRGYVPDCGVWIGDDKIRPTKAEIAEYEERAAKILAATETPEEPEPEPVVAEESEEDKTANALLLELADMELDASDEFEL